jgi:hypothetical protein
MSFLTPILAGAAGSLVSHFMGGGSSSSNGLDAASNALLQEQQAQFEANFALQTHQAMIDNDNATKTAIAQSHAQTATSSTAGARQVGEAQAHIVA